MSASAKSATGTNASHMIVGPDNKVTSCTAQDVSDRVALGRWGARKFNELIGTRGYDLIKANEAGFVDLNVQAGMTKEYGADAFMELSSRLKNAERPPRFGVGMLGSVWVDLTLAGKEVRVALDPSQAKAHGRWGLLLMPLG